VLNSGKAVFLGEIYLGTGIILNVRWDGVVEAELDGAPSPAVVAHNDLFFVLTEDLSSNRGVRSTGSGSLSAFVSGREVCLLLASFEGMSPVLRAYSPGGGFEDVELPGDVVIRGTVSGEAALWRFGDRFVINHTPSVMGIAMG
jgi:hypothetical protein